MVDTHLFTFNLIQLANLKDVILYINLKLNTLKKFIKLYQGQSCFISSKNSNKLLIFLLILNEKIVKHLF